MFAILHDRSLQISDLAVYLGREKSRLTGRFSRAEKTGTASPEPGMPLAGAIDVFLSEQGQELVRQPAANVAEHE